MVVTEVIAVFLYFLTLFLLFSPKLCRLAAQGMPAEYLFKPYSAPENWSKMIEFVLLNYS